jgi:hypothetical protein
MRKKYRSKHEKVGMSAFIDSLLIHLLVDILSQIISQKLQWNAKSKIGSLENATHKPGKKEIKNKISLVTLQNNFCYACVYVP